MHAFWPGKLLPRHSAVRLLPSRVHLPWWRLKAELPIHPKGPDLRCLNEIRQRGLTVEFTRDADAAQAAIQSALADVKRVMPGAQLLEAASDF
jgi:hypothetical protein